MAYRTGGRAGKSVKGKAAAVHDATPPHPPNATPPARRCQSRNAHAGPAGVQTHECGCSQGYARNTETDTQSERGGEERGSWTWENARLVAGNVNSVQRHGLKRRNGWRSRHHFLLNTIPRRGLSAQPLAPCRRAAAPFTQPWWCMTMSPKCVLQPAPEGLQACIS